jgi:hypothetical protein
VLIRLPEGALFLGQYADDGSVRDLTEFAANLLLAGALDAQEAAADGRPEPEELVEAARLRFMAQPAELGAPHEEPSFTWAHLPTGEAGDFPLEQVVDLISRGLSVELTAAVAAETAHEEMPDSPAALDDIEEKDN